MDLKLCFLSMWISTCFVVGFEYSANKETPAHWNDLAQNDLKKARRLKPNIAVAKNVIIFLGDGMGVSTVTAARILKGQLKNETGEEQILSFEHFPHVALSKTYNQDAQTADSAGTATAYFSGIKTNLGILGLDARSRRGVCASESGTNIDGILDWSLTAGKSVGLVTTTRVTHATPGALYAHTAERYWENDNDMLQDENTDACTDIATQLVRDNININSHVGTAIEPIHSLVVIFGGGRNKFLINNTVDPESGLLDAGRLDQDLIELWKSKQQTLNRSYKYMWNKTEFDNLDIANTDYVLGLFNKDHMAFEMERDHQNEPSLAEMTSTAINILKKNPKGFFLLVEGGRIDHGHHYAQAVRALHDTLAFDDAVHVGVTETSDSDTLIVTTADHSHAFTIGGYPTRGNPIFGLTDNRTGGNEIGKDEKTFTTLAYANGPGGYAEKSATVRPDLTSINTGDKDYRQQAGVPLTSETHGGEDVAIYARGPMSHLFHGVHEQNYIAHVMAYASCVGGYSDDKSCAMADVEENTTSSADTLSSSVSYIVLLLAMKAFVIHF